MCISFSSMEVTCAHGSQTICTLLLGKIYCSSRTGDVCTTIIWCWVCRVNLQDLVTRGGFASLLADGLFNFSLQVLKAMGNQHYRTQKACIRESQAMAAKLFVTSCCGTPAASLYTPGMLLMLRDSFLDRLLRLHPLHQR